MLDPNIVTRIREYVDADLSPRDQILGLALMKEQSEAARNGGIGSSRTIFRYSDAGRSELEVRAGLIWTAIRRSYASLSGVFGPSTLDDLRQQIGMHVEAHAWKIAEQCAERVGPSPAADRDAYRESVKQAIRDRASELIARLNIEAQFYVDELKRPAATTASGPVLNFNGPVGAVQTAPFATANVSLAGPEGVRLVEALGQLRQAIERSTEATTEQRAASTDIVGDLIVAAKAEKPNSSKIAGLLGGLATTVQTTASLQPAWQLVKGAAAAVGIPLP